MQPADVNSRLESVAAFVALVVLSPILVAIGAAIKLESRGPAIYQARRMGQGGRTFLVFKFRTMVEGAEKLGPGVTGAEDPRITRLGALLRNAKLDELPQLANVFRSDMSFVGPRPEDPRYARYYSREQLTLLDVKPGITSPASLEFVDERALLSGDEWELDYVERVLPAKLNLELGALSEGSPADDVALIAKTLTRLIRHSAEG
jgi:lipopolysaccharide/colanic/teichoic acid biosynthesis glycosyltransferase